MDAKINKFNERLNLVEEKVESIGFKIEKLIEDNAATAIQLSDLKTNINNSIEDLEKRLKNCQKQIQESKNEFRKEALRNEIYSKRFNILVHGLKENSSNAWETKKQQKEL